MVHRENPTCFKCGHTIEAVYWKLEYGFIGDTFLRWNYEGHKCPKTIKTKNRFMENQIQKIKHWFSNLKIVRDYKWAQYKRTHCIHHTPRKQNGELARYGDICRVCNKKI